MRFLWQYFSGWPFLPPVNHILPVFFIMSQPSSVTLHSMAQSFTELCEPLCHDKALIHEEDSDMMLSLNGRQAEFKVGGGEEPTSLIQMNNGGDLNQSTAYFVWSWFQIIHQFSTVQSLDMSNSLRPHGLQHARPPVHHQLPEFILTHVHWWWYYPTISSSIIPFSSYLQSFPASGSFPMSQFFTSGDHSIRVSDLASVLLMNNQDWFLLGWTGWISLQSKGLSRGFSKTTVHKHQFFSAQLSL